MNTVGTIVVGALAIAVGTVLANKWSGPPAGGGQPNQSGGNIVNSQVPCRTSTHAAPLVQNTPITEAAYNQDFTPIIPALGPNTNTSNDVQLAPL